MSTAFERIKKDLDDDGKTVVPDMDCDARIYAQCPAHNDDGTSLIVTGIEGMTLLHCKQGCTAEAIMTNLGRTLADIYDTKGGANYVYPDGRQVHRNGTRKDFRQSGNTKGNALFRGDRIADAETVYVPEGEKDVLAIEFAGGAAVCSAMGARNAHHADWTPVAGKHVIIIADKDQDGQGYADKVSGLTKGIAASVKVLQAKTGKDAADHVAAAHGLEEFVERSEGPYEPAADAYDNEDDKPKREIFPAPTAPYEVAKKLYADHRRTDGRALVCWRANWMRWNNTHWAEIDAAELRSGIYDVLDGVDYMKPIKDKGEIVGWERTKWEPNKYKVADVMDSMAAIGHLSSEIDPPSWIEVHSANDSDAAQMISCTNGLLNLSTREMSEHTPALFNLVSVPFDYDEAAAEPKAWHAFLASVWGDDEQSIALLQEYFGYVLSGATDMQKMLLLIGPTRSGKGTIARVLTALIGRGHVAGPTLASLGTDFGLSPLLGKPLAIISDARLGNMSSHVVVERLLSITGEDMLGVNRKYREYWNGKLPCRFVIISNELPKFRDSSAAIANRLLILQMTESFLHREDRTLDRRLAAELPGILLWALEGLDRLNSSGVFTVPPSSDEATNLMADMVSPVSAFLRDRTQRKTDGQIQREHLFSAWRHWTEENGHHAGSQAGFGRDLHASAPYVKTIQPREGGKRVRYYLGLVLVCDSCGDDLGSDTLAEMVVGRHNVCHWA